MAEDRQNKGERQSYVVLAQGTAVGHYRIIDRIGTGGTGTGYLAEDTELNHKVALKFPSPNLSQDEDSRKRFKREAQAWRSGHSNPVSVNEVF